VFPSKTSWALAQSPFHPPQSSHRFLDLPTATCNMADSLKPSADYRCVHAIVMLGRIFRSHMSHSGKSPSRIREAAHSLLRGELVTALTPFGLCTYDSAIAPHVVHRTLIQVSRTTILSSSNLVVCRDPVRNHLSGHAAGAQVLWRRASRRKARNLRKTTSHDRGHHHTAPLDVDDFNDVCFKFTAFS
jgi:hypothetical protein